MSSKSDIFNDVMSELGQPNPPSLMDIKTSEVVLFNRLYDRAVGVALSVRQWFWTQKDEEINPALREDNEDTAGWKYKFPVPDGCLRIMGIYATNDMDGRSIAYEMHDKFIFVNSDRCFISYIKKPCESDFPVWFADYIIYYIARRMCMPLTGDKELLAVLKIDEKDAKNNALAADIANQPQMDLPTDAIIGARN